MNFRESTLNIPQRWDREENMRRTTIKDIAKALGITATTVSNALNGKPGVSPANRKKILKTAKAMGYQPNVFARNLVTRKSLAIGLMVSSISDPFYPELARGVQEAASDQGYCMMLFNTGHDKAVEKKSIETLHARGADGIILSTLLQDDDTIALLHKLELPFVLVNRHLLVPGRAGTLDSVVLDNYTGGYEAARHLLRMGHTRMAVMAGDLRASTAILRTQAAQAAMDDYGIPKEDRIVVDCGYVPDRAREAARELLAGPVPPTAFLCQGDNMALAVREAIFEAGLKIPGDIALVGFDDIDFSSVTGVDLTTVSHRQYEMGAKGAELLLKKLDRSKGKAMGQNITLQPELIVRKSCGHGLKGYIME